MTWCAPGFESSIVRLVAGFRAARWPEAPPGFELLGDPRPMRALYRGRIEGPAGPVAVVVKRNRSTSLADRVARLRGGKARREGRALRALEASGVRVPRAIAWAEGDLLVLQEVSGLRALPDAARATTAETRAVAELLARAHAAGLVHRDLTRENLAWADGSPLLLDLGGARVVRRLSRRRLVVALARARNALLGDVSRSARRRALRAYAEAVPGLGDLHQLANDVERAAARIARRYRIGRDRRARRSGREHRTFRNDAARGVLARGEVPEEWAESPPEWLRRDPPGATPLKATGRIVRARVEGRDRDVVIRRFGPATRLVPRPVRCYRAAVALAHRFVPTPAPLFAAVSKVGGVLVTEHVDAADLRTAVNERDPGRPGILRALGRALRRMHDAGVRHRDLKAQNLLVRREPDGRAEVLVADVEGVETSCREIGWRRRARDLGRLDASLDLTPEERAAWIDAYYDGLPFPPVGRKGFDDRIGARAAWKRRRKGGVG